MAFPTQITFHGMEREPELEGQIRDRIQRLIRLSSDITSCRVVVEPKDKVHLLVRLPRTLLSVTKGGKAAEELELGRSVSRAFDAAERALKDFTQALSGVRRAGA
jgi:hypothetical protein